jgi:hypothetical protein
MVKIGISSRILYRHDYVFPLQILLMARMSEWEKRAIANVGSTKTLKLRRAFASRRSMSHE